MKILDEVRYDLFRRIVAAKFCKEGFVLEGKDIKDVLLDVELCIYQLEESGIIGHD